MNDEFLHRLRKEPPPAFAHRLHARLQLQEPERAPPRSRMLRNVVFAFVIVGSAYAGAYLAMNRWPVGRDVVKVAAPASQPQQNAFVTPEAAARAPTTSVERGDFPFVEQGAAKVQASAPSAHRAPVAEENSFGVTSPSHSTSRGRSSVPIPAMPGVPDTRDKLRIVAAAPAAAVAGQLADWYGNPLRYAWPQVDRVESGRDFQAFCKGTGVQYPDIDAAARRISRAEFATCVQNGAGRLIELKLGHQAIVVVRTSAGGPAELSPRDIFLGLARRIPDPADRTRLIDNPNRTWSQVNPQLESQYIEVYGPAPGTPLRSDFTSIAMEAGCDAFPWIEALRETDATRYIEICHSVRQDGAYIETQQTSELVPQKLGASPNAVAVVSYAFYKQNQGALIGNVLGGVDPTLESIGAGSFPGSRTLYLYFKKAHIGIVPWMRRFMLDSTTDRIIGPEGILARAGLVPVSDLDRQQNREIANDLRELKLP